MNWIREKFGTAVILGIIVFVGFVFVFSGVFGPKATRGLHQGAIAGKVNGDAITLAEFNRELNRRLEFFKGLMGGNVNEEQIQRFGLRNMAFQELVQRKLLIQEALRAGLAAGNEQVMESIRQIPAFQKDGKFDLLTYKQVLEQNRYTPSSFERLVREDISAQQWGEYFRRRVSVSDEEARREFLSSENKRKIKYVMLPLAVPPAAKDDKTKKAEKQPQNQPQNQNEQLADELLGLLSADGKSDSKVVALLKKNGVQGVQVKTTEWLVQAQSVVPGIGDATPLIEDAFASQLGKAKKYKLGVGTIVAIQVDSQSPDLEKFAAKRKDIVQALVLRKQRQLYDDWLNQLTKKADIDVNQAVVGGSDSDRG